MESPDLFEVIMVILIMGFFYVIFSLICIKMLFGAIEESIWDKWKNSNKTKFDKLVHLLKLEDFDPEKNTFPVAKKEQPFWYKLLEIIIGFGFWLPIILIVGIWTILYAIYFCIRTTIGWIGKFLEWMFNIDFKQIGNKIKSKKEYKETQITF